MSERAIVDVDEKYLQQMIAGDVPLLGHKMQLQKEDHVDNEKVLQESDGTKDEIEPEVVVRSNKRKKANPDFSETYLKNRKITDRQQLYVCGDVYEKISRYLRVIGDGKISMTSYVNNVLYQHITEHRDIINDLYDSKVSTPL